MIKWHRKNLPLAIVLGASPTGLGVARDLGRYGIPVRVFDYDTSRIGFASRYAAKSVSPKSAANEPELIEQLLELGRHLDRKAVLFPTSDSMVCTVAKYHDQLASSYVYPSSLVPGLSDILIDKRQFAEACRKAGVASPRTAYGNSAEDLEQLVSDFEFPLLLKPTSGHLWRDLLNGNKLLVVHSEKDLTEIIHRFGEKSRDFMVQELIPGDESNLWIAGIYITKTGSPGCCFVGRKLRQHPPRFGSASLAESCFREDVRDLSSQFLESIDFRGVCGTEFKFDTRDGQLKMIEVNQRQTLWFSLIAAAGVDLNLLAYCDLANIAGESIRLKQRDSVRWAYLEKDVVSAVHYLVKGELSPWQWLTSLRGIQSHAVLSLNDPMPALAQCRYFLRRGMSRFGKQFQACKQREQ